MNDFENRTLRIGFIGSGFIANFHLDALVAVRNVDVCGVYSPTQSKRQVFAERVREMGLGQCRPYDSLEALINSPDIDAVWILAPNNTRLDVMRVIHRQVKAGRSQLVGIACEKPLARNLAEAREMLRLVEDTDLLHGYLENQIFCTPVQRGKEILWQRAVPLTGRPYLARTSEEHSGPHESWFWKGSEQGGGALSDLMCHCVEVGRFLLSTPGSNRDELRLKSVSATVANLKWNKPPYTQKLNDKFGLGKQGDYRPVEDFARGTLIFEDDKANELIVEASTSWAYVGSGLRIQLELSGPEYAMEFSSLNTSLKLFLSREVTGSEGEDLVEKQNAEQGLMPVVEDEAGVYGYVNENRHMVESFRRTEMPSENFVDGVAVVEMLMALYKSAEEGRVIYPDQESLIDYVPVVARI
ncbi:MAG: Gfo/Idh/MocA family oxidoreductase [Halieaceae bacterium]|jgi:predicted dehydrogenase|nr:Gfo/Idh/MocA family oxidoreductase [Halieaceae bacterium]